MSADQSRPYRSADELPGAQPERSAIPDRHKWNLEPVFADWSAWETAFAAIESALSGLANLRGTLDRSAADLLAGLTAVMDLRRKLEVVSIYAGLKSDEDTRDGDNLARKGRAGTLGVEFAESLSWLKPELLDIPAPTLAAFLAEEPDLAVYEHFLDAIQRLRPHTLASEQEALLAAAQNVTRGAGSIYSALHNADLRFPDIEDERGRLVELTKGRYAKFLLSGDRRVRRDAFESALDSYGGVINTMAASLDANVKNHVFFARSRGYGSCLEASLYPNDIPPAVYHSLIGTTRANLPAIHRYVDLKRRILGLDDPREYDLYTHLFPAAEFTFEYDEARHLLLEALAPLGEDYLDILREGFDSGWIDVHESAGKRSGAYSNGVYDTSPYILLNWSGELQDTFTLAHELGHSAHTRLTTRHQPFVYGNYPIFTAEVASTCNELLLMHYLLERTEDADRRLFLLDRHLSQINGTVVRQAMFAEFELGIHEQGEANETLTADTVGRRYLELLEAYWGPAVRLDPERSRRSWARIPHFYYNFYVYQYATAYSAAALIARRILAGDAGVRESYLDVLRSGCSRYPVPTLRLAGVDMEKPEPVDEVFRLFSSLLDEVERMVDGR